MDKNHKDLDDIDLSVPRHAQYMHKAWKRHQDTVYWFDINFAMSNAIIFQETLPAYCIPKVVTKEIGEVTFERVYMSTSASTKDLFETRVEKRNGVRTCSTT